MRSFAPQRPSKSTKGSAMSRRDSGIWVPLTEGGSGGPPGGGGPGEIDPDLQMFTDFSEHSTGTYNTSSALTGWEDKWATANKVIETVDGISTNVFNYPNTTFSASRVFTAWMEVNEGDPVSDVEAVTLCHSGSTNINQNALRIRGYGSVGDEKAYYVELNGGTVVQLRKYGAEGVTTLDELNFSWSINVWYWLRLRAIGSLIQAKVWEENDPEPEEWQMEATDTEHTSGFVGFGRWTQGGNKRFRFLGVGLDGTPAPTSAPE